MTVTVTDNRTTLDAADVITNWNLGAVTTTDFAEATGSVTLAINTSTGQLFWTGTGINFTTAGNELIYLWSSNTALQGSWASAVHAMWLSDGTNDLALHEAGNDRDVFKHADNQVQFQCFLIDIDYLGTKNTNGEITAVAGSYASFDETSVSEVGSHFITLSKALAGGTNTFVDIIRYGTEGISITAGTTGARGTFLEIVTEDRATGDLKGHGIIREYTANTYGVQGTMKFGTTSTGDSWFEDSNVVVTFEDRDVSDDKFKLIVLGNVTGGEETHFYLSNSIIASARAGVEVDMSSTGINTLDLNTVTFSNLLNAVSFPSDSASYSHDVVDCTFNNCGQVDPGAVTLTDCSFIDTNAPTTGAMLLDATGSGNMSGLKFTSGGSGHAIYIPSGATGSYTLTDFTYSGYGITGTTDAVIYNNSGGSVTITVTGGDTPSYYNGTSADTTVVSGVNLKLIVKDADGNALVGARCLMEADTGGADPYLDSVAITSVTTTATVDHTGHGLATGEMVNIRGCTQPEYNGAGKVITWVDVDTYTYTISGGPASPATGSPTATQCYISELTIAGGIAEQSYNAGGTQPYRGVVRWSTTPNIWRDVKYSGSDVSGGLILPIQMDSDE